MYKSLQLLLTVAALCWSANDACRTAAVDACLLSVVRRASFADQHSAVTVRSRGKLVRARERCWKLVPCAGLERFQASAEHKPHIDQHQRDAGKAISSKRARSDHKMDLQQPLKRLNRV